MKWRTLALSTHVAISGIRQGQENLTSFKTARLATELDYIDKVIFVVDRKDLDYQTMKEYQNSSQIQSMVATIPKNSNEVSKKMMIESLSRLFKKLNKFITANPNHEVYAKKMCLDFWWVSSFAVWEGRSGLRRPLNSMLCMDLQNTDFPRK